MEQDTYPLNVLDIHKLNSVVRHRLRNLYAGFDMALDTIERDLQAAGSSSTEKCDLLRADLQNLYEFTRRMTLLLDPLPKPTPSDLQSILNESLDAVSKQHPFCDFQCEGTDEPVMLTHGNWYQIALSELLRNAAEATGQEGTVKVAWRTEPVFQIAVLNNGANWPEGVHTSPPVPFESSKGQHDGIGLTIVKRVCDAMAADFEILTDKPEVIGVRITAQQQEVQQSDA